jgi:hypothetical protein
MGNMWRGAEAKLCAFGKPYLHLPYTTNYFTLSALLKLGVGTRMSTYLYINMGLASETLFWKFGASIGDQVIYRRENSCDRLNFRYA